MKTELTKEQSQRLRKLGVPKEKASGKISYGFLGYDPIFRLTDLLDILPKVLHKEGLAYDYNLEMWWQEDMKEWLVTYDAIGDNAGSVFAEELIDGLYRLLCQTIENGHLKFE